MNDIEISRNSRKLPISEVAKKIGLTNEDIISYGDYKAKVKLKDNPTYGKLVLVTAMSPTPLGEGKTTVSIGLGDALNYLGKKTIICLREPSMGPVFGMKGGATGGGLSQVVPMDEINLHFTGDIHAITSANNLISAAIDNHIYFGNSLDIKKVFFKRCLDVNDRALRSVNLGSREESFNISSASEIMALFCLATSLDDLRERLGRIVVGINSRDEFVYVKDLKLEGSLMALLKDAINPNLVQTLENTPSFVHGGPFANIAHGCNTAIATRTAMTFGDYVVTEAGFGADLGAEKFLDIKCRKAGLCPKLTVLVATTQGLKMHGGVALENIKKPDADGLQRGFENLDKHIKNIRLFGQTVVVCFNRYDFDTDEEIEMVRNHCKEKGVAFAINNAFLEGGNGAVDLANIVVDEINNNPSKPIAFQYNESDDIKTKVEKVARYIYGADSVAIIPTAQAKIKMIEQMGYADFPVCIAKTQYSFSDDPKKYGVPKNFEFTISDFVINAGAEMIVAIAGSIMRMPGLPRTPQAENIDVVGNEIIGLS